MASKAGVSTHKSVHKRTSQGGSRPKTSTMSKTEKRTFKRNRGQGR
jgi:hypothetical protein